MTPTLLTIAGETRAIAEWARIPGAVDRRTIHRRLARHCDPEQAVFGPTTRRPNAKDSIDSHVQHQPRPKGFRYPVTLTQWGSVSSVTWSVSA